MPNHYDAQADDFDARAGLPPSVARAAADAILKRGQPREDELVLEIGTGTGSIGCWLGTAWAHYVGMDLSPRMLQRARRRDETPHSRLLLVCADAAAPWPVANDSVRIVFGSRTLHLLDVDHVLREGRRVSSSRGGVLIVGRVERPADSLTAKVRRAMRRQLTRYGIEGRSGDRAVRTLAERTGSSTTTEIVATWTTERSAADILAAWRNKPGLGGHAFPPPVQREILSAVENWARQEVGNLEEPHPIVNQYVLHSLVLELS